MPLNQSIPSRESLLRNQARDGTNQTDRSHTNIAEAIQWLGSHAPMTRDLFGGKASSLHSSSHLADLIPKGFAISPELVSTLVHGARQEEIAYANEALTLLILKSESKKLIVRSSSRLENNVHCQMPGVFRSIADVTTFRQFIAALIKCFKSGSSELAKSHLNRHGINPIGHHMAVLVQEQIQCEYSAVVQVGRDHCLAEIYLGGLAAPIRGSVRPAVIQISDDRSESRIQLLQNSDQVSREVIASMGAAVGSVVEKARPKERFVDVQLELGFSKGKLYVFQVRETKSLSSANDVMHRDGLSSLPHENHLGFKAAAMKYFQDSGLFTLPCVIIEPKCNDSDIRARLAATKFGSGHCTVRYSHGREIGLPRKFVESDDLYNSILMDRRIGWSTIVHAYIDVRRSFEILLDEASILLEHIPGMWESDNCQAPDVLSINERAVKAWRWTAPRLAKMADSAGCDRFEAPVISRAEMETWAARLLSFAKRLRNDFESDLPLNLHFVEDARGEWHFLNIRTGFMYEKSGHNGQTLHCVRNKQDLKRWDGKKALLLRVTSKRGSEREMLPLIEALQNITAEIYVDFGILSHPAMLLREYGINVRPRYLSAQQAQGYDIFDFDVDQGLDPIKRIMSEPPVFKDDNFRVVYDRDPITKNHLLVVANAGLHGFSELREFSDLDILLKCRPIGEAFNSQEWIFLERGRARFCTSGFTDKRAHGHLLPAEAFVPSLICDLAEATEAKYFESLQSALQEARAADGEYLLFSKNGESYYLATAFDRAEKRFLRRFLVERTRDGSKV